MATIPRDVAFPLAPLTEERLAEFEAFAADVPTTDGIISALNGIPTPPGEEPSATRANLVRGRKMIRPALVAGLLPGDAFPTPDRVESPDIQFERQGFHDTFCLVPGLGPVSVWSFQDNVTNEAGWPAPIIRVREGQIVDSLLNSRVGPHTIHHHGIEPTPMNDGVGHLTMEVGSGTYTYRWLAAEEGTYFYHCHRNTVLHFERGMYGALIIDPDVSGAPFRTGGPGQTHVGNSLVDYAAEALWVVDEFDTRWHGLRGNGLPLLEGHAVAVGLQSVDSDARTGFMRINDPDNPRLHDFKPNVFLVSGVAAPYGEDNALIMAPGTPITPQVQRGQRVLIRALNAAYAHTRWKFPPELPGLVIAADGRSFGREPFGRYSSPVPLDSLNHEFQLSVARRWNVLLDTSSAAPGNYDVQVTFHHWITDAALRTIRMRIVVTP